MKRYCVIRERSDTFPKPGAVVFGIGMEGEPKPLIRDFSSESKTEEVVHLLNENKVLKVHFWDIVVDSIT